MAYTKKIWKDYPYTTTPILADDLNNIENGIEAVDTVVNNGWVPATETWEFVSATDPVGVIKVNADVTTKYSEGMKIKITNGGNIIFGKFLEIGTYGGTEAGYTYLTFLHEINPINSLVKNLMVSGLITNNYYSTMHTPYGFPVADEYWTLYITDTNQKFGTPSNNAWWNPSGFYLPIPKGKWKIFACAGVRSHTTVEASGFAEVSMALSTSATSATIPALKVGFGADYPHSGLYTATNLLTIENTYIATSPVNLYLLHRINTGGTIGASNGFNGFVSANIIKAVYAY